MMGNAMSMGARIAAEQVNRAGGVLGKKIELVVRDDKASPAESALVAREVLGGGIKFIVGGLLTAPSLAVNNLLQENNALFIQTGAQVIALTHENFNPNAFRSNVNSIMSQSASAAAMPIAHPNITKWIGVAPDNQFGTDNYRNFTTALRKAYKAKLKKDVEIADPVLVPFPATDFKVAISRLMSGQAEGLYIGSVGADFYTFMAQGHQLGLYNKMKVFVEAGSGIQIAQGLGVNLPKDNLWTPTTWYPQMKDANEVSKQLVKDAAAISKGPVDNMLWNGHTGMLALLNAIKNAKSLETPVVRVALERVEFQSANGPFRFRREDHQGIANISVLKIQQKAGEPGWEVGRVITVPGEEVIEPAGPGQKYTPA